MGHGHKIKSRYSVETGKAKGELYKSAYQRIPRAIAIGAHIEAVVLIESLMSDRIESAISVLTDKEVKASTLGKLISDLTKLIMLDDALKADLFAWNESRAFVVHQMVKLTNNEISTWNQRIAFARQTAKDGYRLLLALRKVTDKIISNGR